MTCTCTYSSYKPLTFHFHGENISLWIRMPMAHLKLELSRAHTPYTPCIQSYLHQFVANIQLLITFTVLHVGCAHEQKVNGLQRVVLMGGWSIKWNVATLVDLIKWFEGQWRQFLTISMAMLCLQAAQLPRSPDLAIFVVTGQNDSCICVPGVM